MRRKETSSIFYQFFVLNGQDPSSLLTEQRLVAPVTGAKKLITTPDAAVANYFGCQSFWSLSSLPQDLFWLHQG